MACLAEIGKSGIFLKRKLGKGSRWMYAYQTSNNPHSSCTFPVRECLLCYRAMAPLHVHTGRVRAANLMEAKHGVG